MESLFQFSNPSLIKLNFITFDDFIGEEGKDIQLKLNISTRVNRKKSADDAFVVLCVTIGENTNKYPFYIYAEEAARFKWPNGAYTEEMIKKLLKQNAPALLLSYLRPIIANITGSSPYGTYDLPFMNFTK